MSQTRKVLWITSSYPRFENDSASIFLRYLAESIQENGFTIQVLAPDDTAVKKEINKYHFKYFFPRRLQKLAYGSGILPNLKNNPFLYLQIPFFITAMFLSTWRLTCQIRPNIIHAHWIFPQGLIAVVIGKLFKVPTIITAHGSDTFELKGSLISFLKKWSLCNCSAWTSNSFATASALSQVPTPIIIPMGVSIKSFYIKKDNESKNGFPDHYSILLFVGRLYPNKGAKELIQAFSQISENLKNKVQLWIIGDGVERRNLESQSRLLGLEDKVIFHGSYPNNQLPNFYAVADILIAPSLTAEGQGLTILEAFASQTAVISSGNGGVAEFVVDRKNGLLINPNDTNAFANAIEELLINQELRESLAFEGKMTAKQYDWQSVGLRFSELYKVYSG